MLRAASTATRSESTVDACCAMIAHLGVNVIGERANVLRVGAAKLVSLIVNLDTNAAVAVGLSQASLPNLCNARNAPLTRAPLLRFYAYSSAVKVSI